MLNNHLISFRRSCKFFCLLLLFGACSTSSEQSKPKDLISKTLRQHIPELRSCYNKEREKNPDENISGSVGTTFTILPSGEVTSVVVKSKSELPVSMKNCLMKSIEQIKFPKSLGGKNVDVIQPFNFYPKNP